MNNREFDKIEKMSAEGDIVGLRKLLEHPDGRVRLEAAAALAESGDSLGWHYLGETIWQKDDPVAQASAAAELADLDPARAIPILGKALVNASGQTAEAIKQALEGMGIPAADAALRQAGYEPVLPHMTGNVQLIDYGGEYVRSLRPENVQIEFLSAEQHLSLAIELRETGLVERGLVEDSLALWLSPEWADAWTLRGELFADLGRPYEATLCCRWALELDPGQAGARAALDTLHSGFVFPTGDGEILMRNLSSGLFQERRDTAAGLGDMGSNAPEEAVSRLIELLRDDEREVRHAAIEALGNINDRRAVRPLLETEEVSWLLRFAVIEALAQLGSAEGLADKLRREMDRIQQRNPVFSREKDPMLEVEYERLQEIGVLAFGKTGDIEALVAIAEGNAWAPVEKDVDQDVDGLEEESEADLEAYVDEVALMVNLALERLALPDLANQSLAVLERLAAIPDLTRLDPTAEDDEPVVLHDLGALREAARAELAKR